MNRLIVILGPEYSTIRSIIYDIIDEYGFSYLDPLQYQNHIDDYNRISIDATDRRFNRYNIDAIRRYIAELIYHTSYTITISFNFPLTDLEYKLLDRFFTRSIVYIICQSNKKSLLSYIKKIRNCLYCHRKQIINGSNCIYCKSKLTIPKRTIQDDEDERNYIHKLQHRLDYMHFIDIDEPEEQLSLSLIDIIRNIR